MMRGTAVSGGQQRRATWDTFAGIPCQVGDKRCYLPRFCGNSVPGRQQEVLPDTLSREFRGRWTAGRDTWNAFAGFPCQVGSRERHLEHFRRKTVPGGRRERTPGILLQEFRARWAAGRDTWNAFAGIPCQVGSGKRHLERFCRETVPGGRRERTPGTLLQGNRGRWAAGKEHLTRFCGKTVAGGQREGTPGILLRENRSRWAAEKGHLKRFCGDSVPGGRQEVTPGTLSREYRARWTAGRCHLERFRGETVAGGRQRRTPDTLLRGFRAR